MKNIPQFSRAKRCPNCGSPLDNSLIVCVNCGTAIVKKPVLVSHLLIGLAFALVFFSFGYFVFFPVINLSSGNLTEHPINLVIVFVVLWELFFIVSKLISYFGQRRAMDFFKSHEVLDLLMDQEKLKVPGVEGILSELHKMLKAQGFVNPLELIVFERVRKMLFFLKAVPHQNEMAEMLAYQADIDMTRVDSEFSPLKVFHWALPTLGFLGTVLGIGSAIQEFSSFLSGAGAEISAEAIKSNLTGVISGLGMAFDSTMLALLLLLLLLPMASYIENLYTSILNEVEEYCITFIAPNIKFSKE